MGQYHPESFESLLEGSLGDLAFKPDTIVDAVVVAVDRYRVTLDTGLPIEGFVPVSEFDQKPEVGQTVKVIIDALDDGNGNILISHDKAVEREAKELIFSSIESGSVIEAKVVSAARAGMFVKIRNVDGFMPNSHVAVMSANTIREELIGQTVSVVPMSYDPKKKNVVVSRKLAMIKERGGVMEPLEGEVKIGDIREGIVKNVMKYGAFVDLGGVDCLIHVTDAVWNPMAVNPSEFFHIGQRVKGLINKMNHHAKPCMSLRALDRAPWESAKKEIAIGEKVEATVYKVDDNRNLLVIVNGVQGVIPSNEISWGHIKLKDLIAKYPSGSKIEVILTGYEEEYGLEQLVFSLKACDENPWKKAKDLLVEGNKVTATIKSFGESVVFINLAKDIDGIVPFKELCWVNPQQKMSELSVGDKLEVLLINVNFAEYKVTASLKQNEKNPFSGLKKGSDVECEIVKFSKSGDSIFVKVDHDDFSLEGAVSSRHAIPQKVKENVKASEYYNVGDKVTGTVVNIDGGKVMISFRGKRQEKVKEINNAMKDALERAKA